MSNSARVNSPHVLKGLRLELSRFKANVEQHLSGAATEAHRAKEWLEERQRHWHREKRRSEEFKSVAELELAASLRQPGSRSNCADAERRVYVAQARLEEAERQLGTIRIERRRVEQSIANYEGEARKLAVLLETDIPQAMALLRAKSEILESYLSVDMPSSVGSGSRTTRMRDVGQSAAKNLTTGDTEDTPLAAIELTHSSVTGPGDFEKVEHTRVVDGFARLEQIVRPAVEIGYGGEYFTKLDVDHGLSYDRGYRRVYDAFYGDDAIVLDKVGERYQVTNGYHRLHVAKELGLETVPARVLGK